MIGLNARQFYIVEMLSAGYTHKQISTTLNMDLEVFRSALNRLYTGCKIPKQRDRTKALLTLFQMGELKLGKQKRRMCTRERLNVERWNQIFKKFVDPTYYTRPIEIHQGCPLRGF